MVLRAFLPFLRFPHSLLLLAYLIPPVLLTWFVVTFNVNVPYWDDWAIVPLFEKVAEGNANFSDFFEQHNEHRILLPKIIITALAFATKWNIDYQIYLSIALTCVNFIVLYKISTQQLRAIHLNNSAYWKIHLANLVICLLIFSWSQYEVWLSGICLVWPLTNTCLLIAISIVFLPGKLTNIQRLLISAVFCTLASFSMAHGLFSWLCIFPALLTLPAVKPRKKFGFILLWISLFIASCVIYFANYRSNQDYHFSIFFEKPIAILTYFVMVLGSPGAIGRLESLLLGLTFLAIFLYFVYCYFKNFNSQFSYSIEPWLAISLFALLYAFLTTVGRGLPTVAATNEPFANNLIGISSSLTSRYESVSVLFVISLINMICISVISNTSEAPCTIKETPFTKFQILSTMYALFIALIFCFTLTKYSHAIEEGNKLYTLKTNLSSCLQLVNYTDMDFYPEATCLHGLYPSAVAVKEYARILEKLEFRDFPDNLAFITTLTNTYGEFETAQSGGGVSLNKSQNQQDSIVLSGWSVFPNHSETPRIVLLSANEKRTFFSSAYVSIERPDIAEALQSNDYLTSGWILHYPIKYLPIGDTAIKAWVYNPSKKAFVKLGGELILKLNE